jgi:hypothetical protein
MPDNKTSINCWWEEWGVACLLSIFHSSSWFMTISSTGTECYEIHDEDHTTLVINRVGGWPSISLFKPTSELTSLRWDSTFHYKINKPEEHVDTFVLFLPKDWVQSN